MKLVGADQQQKRHPLYDASGVVVAGGTPQLVLAQSQSRSFLKIQNLSNGPLWFEFGSARATCAITNGAVSGFTITNAGFGFTKQPVVRLLGGGGKAASSAFLGLGQPNGHSPANAATAVAAISGGALTAISISNPGANYLTAPYVFIFNSDLDPYGCAAPSPTSGMLLGAQSAPYVLNGTTCTTDPIAVYGATTGQSFMCKWMD